MKKVISIILLTFLFIINVNAEVSVDYDTAMKTSQRYIYRFNKYDKYLITDTKYKELKGSNTAIIPFLFKNKTLSVDNDFTRGGLLNEEEFNTSKDSNGNTYLSQDVEFFLIGKKVVNTLNNEVIDAGDKKYGVRVTEFVLPGTKTKGLGTKINPWEFVGTHKIIFYISNGKITNVNPGVTKYTVYAIESNEGQIVINFEPNNGFEYLNNNCDFKYEYDQTNKIHRIVKNNKDINNDFDCTIKLKTNSFIVEYDYNGGTGSCENLAVANGNKINKLCTNVSREGYTFKGWKDEKGNTITNDTVVTDNMKLIAQWEIKKSILTIKPNGGVWNNQTETKTIEQDYNTTIKIDNPSKGPNYTITFDANNQAATISKNTVEAERTFNNWKLIKESTDTTVKFENGTFTFGSDNATLEASYGSESNNTSLSTISKTGYTCKWNTKADGTGTSYSSGASNYTTSSNVTLYAICTANTYKVTLNNQSATSAGTSTVNATYGKNISNITVPSKSYKVTFVYDSTKTEEKTVSYKFGGYYTQVNGSGTQFINANGAGSKAYNLTSDTTLYAKWTASNTTLPTPTKSGYTFSGWYTASSGGTKVGDGGSSYTPTSNITLYAQWTSNTYKLTVNPNGGTWNGSTSSSTFTATAGSTKTIANPTSPNGYTVTFNVNGGSSVSAITSQRTFSNWSLTGSGSISGSTYTFGAGNGTLKANYQNGSITLPSTSKAGYKFKGWYDNGCSGTLIGNSGDTYTPTKNITLKACYAYYAYKLYVNPNGGTWNGSTSTTKIDPLADPKPTINGQTDYTGRIGSTINIANPTPPTGYTVSFNTNGENSVSSITSTKSFTSWTNSGAGSISGTTFTYGEGNGSLKANYKNNSITLPNTTKSGYTFNGWYTSSSGGTKVGTSGSSYTPTSNITLYAQWTRNTYTLTIDPNGGKFNGSTSNTTVTGKLGETVSLSNLTVPSGIKATFNANGGSCSTSSLSTSKSLLGWYFMGSEYGSISGSTYTFGKGNDTIYPVFNTHSITLPNATRTGYTFNGWYTASSGGTKVGKEGSSYTPKSNTTLYAQWTPITYNISYDLIDGTHGSSHPTSATYDNSVNISNPTKNITVKLITEGTTASGATISSTSASANQTFNGWTASNLSTATAMYGSSTSTINTSWSSDTTKVKNTYFKNLNYISDSTVTLTANWGQKSITLPKITKSGYICGWATSSNSTTITYASNATYTPNANGKTSVNLYGVCKSNSAPSLKVTFKTSAGYSDYCTSAYTASNGSCTFNSGYYTPLTLTLEATDENTITKMTFEYNASGQTSYTDVKYTENVTFVKSGNTYTGTRTIGSAGKRKFKITATNNIGKTSTVIMNINAVKQTFASTNGCSNKTLTASGNIYVWKGESGCTNANQSGCDQMEKNTLGIISKGAELCYVKTISSTSNVKFIAAWIETSQFKYKGGVLTPRYPGYGTATTKTFDGKTYYYSKLTGWCNNSSCGYGWVVNPPVE